MSRERVAVLFVDHATALGGAEQVLLTLLRDLDRTWLVPHVATQPGALADAARALGVAVHELPLRRLRHPLAAWRLGRGAYGLRRLIRREAITLVHANTVRASLYASAALPARGCGLVWYVHDIVPSGWFGRRMCRVSAAVIAVSAAVAAALPCAAKVQVISNGVHPEDFAARRPTDAAQLRAQWGIPPDATLVAQIARLQPWKGQRDVIAVAEMLREAGDRLYVVIVGGDIFGDAAAYAEDLKAMIGRRHLAAHVRLVGHCDDIAAVLNAVDIVVHASDCEPFGMALIEAGAAARPVVAYASGGVPEILRHEHTGLLVPAGDRAALAAALRRLLRDPQLARSLGAAARAEVQARFDARDMARKVEAVYARVLGVASDRGKRVASRAADAADPAVRVVQG